MSEKTDAQLLQELKESLENGFKKCKETFSLPNWKQPKLDISSLRGTTAGTANYGDNKIRVNWVLYKQNANDFLKRTVVHELAHHVNFQMHGAKQDGHGPRWRWIMQRLGVTGALATRCHSYSVADVRPSGVKIYFQYKCGCSNLQLVDAATHSKMLRGGRFACVRCKHELKYTNQTVRK